MAILSDLLKAAATATGATPMVAAAVGGSDATTIVVEVAETEPQGAAKRYWFYADVKVEYRGRGYRDDYDLLDEVEQGLKTLLALPNYYVQPNSGQIKALTERANDRRYMAQVRVRLSLEV